MATRINWGAIGMVLLLLSLPVLGGLAAAWAPVNEGNVKVVLNKGKATSVLGPGWHVINPVTEGTRSLNVRPQTYTMSKTAGEGQKEDVDDSVDVLTNDGVKVSVDISVRYRVDRKNALAFYRQYRDLDNAQAVLIRPTIRSELRTEAGNVETNTIYTGKGQDHLRGEVATALREEFEGSGLILEEVQVRGIDLPPNYQKAIESKEIQKQTTKKEKLHLEVVKAQNEQKIERERAQSKQKQIRAEADAKVKRINANADAEVRRINADAEADANALIAESLSDELIQYEYAKGISRSDTTYFFGDSVNGNSPVLTKGVEEDEEN